VLRVDHVTKDYVTRQGRRRVLKDVNFELKRGQHLGIIGRNGAGKSTLIRLLSGAERPTSGRIVRNMRISWPLAFAGAFHPHLTGLDNLKFICRVYSIDYKPLIPFVEDFTELGVYFREPVQHYSYGMMTRLAFALSMAIEFDCFLIDEAMVAGDIRFHERCHHELFVKRKDRAFILVTHDWGPIRDQCDSVCVLHDGRLLPFEDMTIGLEWYRSMMLDRALAYEAQPLGEQAASVPPTEPTEPVMSGVTVVAADTAAEPGVVPVIASDRLSENTGSTKIDRLVDFVRPGREYRFILPRIPSRRRMAERKTILVLGNCQARPFASCLQALCPEITFMGVELSSLLVQGCMRRDRNLRARLDQYEWLVAHPEAARLIVDNFPDLGERVTRFPNVTFSAYHPDLVYVHATSDSISKHLYGPLGHYNSAIALWGYQNRLSIDETVGLFNERTYETLGYFQFWQSSRQSLVNDGTDADMPLQDSVDRWSHRGVFMYSINHPKMSVFADIGEVVLRRLQLPRVRQAGDYADNEFVRAPIWPVYPEVATRLGLEGGDYLFKVPEDAYAPDKPVVMLDLREFVGQSFNTFSQYRRDNLRCERLQSGRFKALENLRSRQSGDVAAAIPERRRTPYSDLPPHQFWKSAVASVPRAAVDPVVRTRFQISKRARIATAGSCFAQHISATLRRFGFNYYLTEPAAEYGLTKEEAQRRMYDVYSARYGNIYTARQLLQLYQRALGRFVTSDIDWQRADGRYVDAFRPLAEPDGLVNPQTVALHMIWHLNRVRELFENLDVLVFTLGLTEAWRCVIDGAVYPVAPGVAGGTMDSSRYEFVNFTVSEVVNDLEQFLALLREHNPRAQVILTVSPVPLIATYEPQHALVANTYSKSVLRAAAGEICARHKNCDYFPSYEIVTGNYARGIYFDSSLRTVTSEGVDHVMRLFLKHFAHESGAESVDPEIMRELSAVKEIYCDEEAIAT
jgi:ABC-type polysaccharide/polyol phosphate transport system ATPase subunit